SSIPPSSPSRSSEDAEAHADDQSKDSVSATPSVLNKITAKIPSLRGLLFDVPSPSPSLSSQPSIREGIIRERETENVASRQNQRWNKARSESGATVSHFLILHTIRRACQELRQWRCLLLDLSRRYDPSKYITNG
ncbi:unnamed protein product, partial [Ascophyllum nodosum]